MVGEYPGSDDGLLCEMRAISKRIDLTTKRYHDTNYLAGSDVERLKSDIDDLEKIIRIYQLSARSETA